MRLLVDLGVIFFMCLFSYSLGRKSQSDGRHVIPPTVTWFTVIIVIIIMLILNASDIWILMKSYSGK